MLVEVRPAHGEGLAAAGAEEQEELDGAGDGEAGELLAVLEDRILLAGGQRVHGFPQLLDLFVRKDPLTRALRAQALQAGRWVVVD